MDGSRARDLVKSQTAAVAFSVHFMSLFYVAVGGGGVAGGQ